VPLRESQQRLLPLMVCIITLSCHLALATFQHIINRVIGDLEGCRAYIDDVIVYDDDWDKHVKQLFEFLCRPN